MCQTQIYGANHFRENGVAKGTRQFCLDRIVRNKTGRVERTRRVGIRMMRINKTGRPFFGRRAAMRHREVAHPPSARVRVLPLNRALHSNHAGKNKENGVAKGTRTLDDRNHNPGLYQLSYSHHRTCFKLLHYNGAPEGITRLTPRPAGPSPLSLRRSVDFQSTVEPPIYFVRGSNPIYYISLYWCPGRDSNP